MISTGEEFRKPTQFVSNEQFAYVLGTIVPFLFLLKSRIKDPCNFFKQKCQIRSKILCVHRTFV